MAELGASPVADYSQIGQQGFQISQQAAMRAEKQQNELKAAYAATEQQRSAANQAMMSLPPEAAQVMSLKLEEVMAQRAKAIMGGSSIATGQSGQEFQDLAITAAKIGAVNKDLVDKYQRVRQSEEYSKNKLAYDTWYNSASQTIAIAAESGLEGASQLDFFQPPILQPDADIVQTNIPLYQRDFNPNQYQVVNQSGLTTTTTFDEPLALENAKQFTAEQYAMGPGNKTFTDLNYQTSLRLHPELANEPEKLMEIGDRMTEPGGLEDELSNYGITTTAEIDALNVPASKKRELKNTLTWVNQRAKVMEDHEFQLVESVRFTDKKHTAQGSGGGPKVSDFPRSSGEASNINLSTTTATNAGYSGGQKFGFAGNKNGTAKKFGQGAQSKGFDGIIFDGTNYKAIIYTPKQSWINQIIAGTASASSDIATDMFDPNKYEQQITDLSVIQGAIPSGDLTIMKKIAEEEYLDAI